MNKYIRHINIIKNNDLQTLEKLLHDDFMFIRESGLVTRDEYIEHIKMLRTERIGYWGDNGWKNCSEISPGKSSPKRKEKC